MSIIESSLKERAGFTMVELLIVIAIIGTLVSIAIPTFTTYQLRTKSSEVKTNLSAIGIAEGAEYTDTGQYLRAAAEPAAIPGNTPAPFNLAGSDYAALGWNPEGNVYFSYAVEITADGTGYTADAAADIDGDGILQIWGLTKPNGVGAMANGGMGCDPTLLTPDELGSCVADTSIY